MLRVILEQKQMLMQIVLVDLKREATLEAKHQIQDVVNCKGKDIYNEYLFLICYNFIR